MTMRGRTEWREGMCNGVEWEVATSPDEEGETLSFNEWRTVKINLGNNPHEFRVKRVDSTPASISIRLERLPREMLCEEVQAAIINAVSLNTMPVINWA